MSAKRIPFLCLLLSFQFFLLWGLALHAGQWMQANYEGVSVRVTGTPLPQSQLTDAWARQNESELTSMTAWSRSDAVTVKNSGLQTVATARVITVLGDMRRVCPATLVDGSYPYPNDTGYCVIDLATANMLFHSADVVGARLSVDQVEYTVVGVVDAYERMLMLRSSSAAATYANLEFTCADAEQAHSLVESFLYRYKLTNEYVLVESGVYMHILSSLLGMPGWIFGFATVGALLHEAHRRRAKPLSCGVLLLTAAGSAGMLIWLLAIYPDFPQMYLPTKWSDFSFWGKQFDQWRQAWQEISLLTPMPKEVQFFSALRQCLMLLAAATATGLLLMGQLQLRLQNDWEWLGVLLMLLITTISIALLRLHGIDFVWTRGYLCALPLWRTAKLILCSLSPIPRSNEYGSASCSTKS
ncbi:MAG: ABC transporter permease [Clostridia bacterium]